MPLTYAAYRVGQFLALTLPRRGAYWLAERLADLQYTHRRQDRAAVHHNLTAVLGGDAVAAQRLTRQVFRNFGKYLVDFLRLPRVDRAFVDRSVRVVGLEHLRETLARHGGALSVTAHLGNWELAGAVTARLGLPVAAVALTHADPRVTALFNEQRRAQGVTGIAPGFALRHCQRAIAQGQVVALLGDRNYTSRGVPCQLLGRTVNIPRGPALLSVRTGVPIVPGFLVRDADPGRYVLSFEPPLSAVPAVGDREAAIAELTQRYVQVIERHIQAHPAQWFLFRPFDVAEVPQ